MVDRLEPLLEQAHGFVAGRHVDARVLVGEVLVGDHDPPWFHVFDPLRPLSLRYRRRRCDAILRRTRASDASGLAGAGGRVPGAGLRRRRRSCDSWAMAPRAGHPYRRRPAFAVRWSRRRRTIGISIPREGPPLLAAPVGCRRATLETAVRDKLPWVRRKLAERAALPELAPPTPLRDRRVAFPIWARQLRARPDRRRAGGRARGHRPRPTGATLRCRGAGPERRTAAAARGPPRSRPRALDVQLELRTRPRQRRAGKRPAASGAAATPRRPAHDGTLRAPRSLRSARAASASPPGTGRAPPRC